MIAIVTGASRGIGQAIALRLANDGARVVLCARDAQALRETASAIQTQSLVFPVDLREPDAAGRLVNATIAAFGAIDVLVNNAGATKRGDFLALTDNDFQDGFELKYFGAVRLSRAAWPHLRATSGSIVNIVGVGGRTPGAEFAIGGSVNAALLSLTKALAELGIREGVQVNAINPGPVQTARFERRLEQYAAEHNLEKEKALELFVAEEKISRIGQPSDIAAMVAFILSPAGRLLQGSLIDMDGGHTKTL
jgi:NAD(P)-dependent dehydrogenase (short-subunit alcohol dehydrogenase family)